MALRLNTQVWNSMFAIPTGIADEHLRRVNGQQLKVILYLLRHNGENLDIQALAEGVGMDKADAKDAMQYWVEAGYVYEDGNQPKPLEPVAAAPAVHAVPAPQQKVLVEVPDVLPTHEQIAARTLEDPVIAGFFNEVQARLGKTVGYDSQAKFIMMMDSYGLPPEVILTIVEYATSHGKTGMAYICKVGKNWAEQGIDSLEKAEERLKALSNVEKLWKDFVTQFSVDPPSYTDKRSAFLQKWRLEWKQSNELIFYAYEEMVDNINKVNFNYLDKILENWRAQGIKTPQEALQAKKTGPQTSGKPASKTATQKTTSYDSDAYKKKARGPIEYKRKEEQ